MTQTRELHTKQKLSNTDSGFVAKLQLAQGYSVLHTLSLPHLTPTGTTTSKSNSPKTAHHKHTGCTPQTRQLLGRSMRILIDVASGRRSIDSLIRFPMSNSARSTLRSIAREGSIKGASLRSFHPNPAATSQCVDFVGTIEIGGRVRAFSGRFKHSKNPSSWKLDTFHLV